MDTSSLQVVIWGGGCLNYQYGSLIPNITFFSSVKRIE